LNKSNTVDSKRSLASAYLAAGNYQAAEQTMKDIAAQTKDRNDYLGLLNICSVRNVPDKQACIDDAVANIKPQIDKLSFFQVYSAASELDNAGFKKDAVVFYQRAYDIYDPARVDQYTKTRDQIKQKIDELSK
jgi:tetratricopeptide (TPR) repeat protein